ncbi:3-oxoacid CoA-transferase subunit B [Jiangella asiatica]|uniref:3-oxoacid CoA-transferase subunit B n=1 Tax=Jiangella asiatica TaxID=2530372 RepID=A0A4R5CS74_9ACTN|nr:3-oxoacid CoA-transferase subunit B [Jiangella asiatica]TDE03126.1 3-oxoacid CoA-transferase subunit B [Jiangella asiatica]
MSRPGWDVPQQARQVARRLPRGGYVNLGIGLPAAVADQIDPDQHVVFHCENGLIGYRGMVGGDDPDPDVIDAGSRQVALIPGAAVVGHDLSFAIARGGRLDATVLGAYQVSADGDLANWTTPAARLSGVGGAMDLALGAKQVIVMMRHRARDGAPKIVQRCSYPLTARRCVGLVVTELAVIEVTADGLAVRQLAPDITFDDLQNATDAPLLAPSATP